MPNIFFKHQEVTEAVITCAIKIHRALGPGLLESAYSRCIEYELLKAGRVVDRERQAEE